MRALDLQKKVKKKPVLPPTKNIQKNQINYKEIYQILLLISIIIVFIIFFYLFPLPQPGAPSYNSSDLKNNSKDTILTKNQITIYINSNEKNTLEQINNQLNTEGLKATLVYRPEITKNIIYCAKDQTESAVKISSILNTEFEIKESTTADTTGIVVYYKK